MNISFIKGSTDLRMEYVPGSGCEWIDDHYKTSDCLCIKKIFLFSKKDVVDLNSNDTNSRTFVLGIKNKDGYYEIKKEILNLNNSLFLSETLKITPQTFLSIPDNISIFKKIDKLVSEPVYIGGTQINAIPISDFYELLSKFPTNTELKHYADSRIQHILEEYIGTMTDSQKKLERYISMKEKGEKILELEILREFELQKYIFIRDRIKEMLSTPDSYSEKDWENKILEFILTIYPKYIEVLHSIPVKDTYSDPCRATMREIDLGLLDTNGNLDIIEIKKPFPSCILSTNKYRDNYIPKKELSGAVVQAEKYIFHLNKWGIEGENHLNKKYVAELPVGLKIKIVNPKTVLILGRSRDFDDAQKFDFEIIRRKYSNIMDIITYDDLIERLEHIIQKFGGKSK